ncbi:MAG: biotin--[acetyl-CoA-carboxylase] ligase [Terracoccus sp.]
MRIPLDETIIGERLVTSSQPWRGVHFLPRTGSTNDRARELVTRYAADPAGAPDPLWSVVLTDHQTGGRGRLGRAWEVPDRAAISVSAVVPAPASGDAAWFPLLAGLALARAVAATTAEAGLALTPRLKWPNDVLLADDGDRKVSGILCELVPLTDPPSDRRAVVVGTGVNVDQARDELPVPTATSLALAEVTVRREDLVVAYLTELAALLLEESTGPAGPSAGSGRTADGGRAAYRSACATVGSEVKVHLPAGVTVEGWATGIDDGGRLVVETAAGRQTFAAGDVVHVRRPGGSLA